MADKILKEAFDRLTAIEEADDYVPMSAEQRDKERRMRDARNKTGQEDSSAIGYPGEHGEDENVTEDSGEDVQDGLDELWGIQEEMYELIERLDSAIRAYVPDQHRYWQSYGLAQLKVIAGSDEYAASDESINNLIDNLKAKVRGGDEHTDDPERGVRQR